jgi:hypothetical protein
MYKNVLKNRCFSLKILAINLFSVNFSFQKIFSTFAAVITIKKEVKKQTFQK